VSEYELNWGDGYRSGQAQASKDVLAAVLKIIEEVTNEQAARHAEDECMFAIYDMRDALRNAIRAAFDEGTT